MNLELGVIFVLLFDIDFLNGFHLVLSLLQDILILQRFWNLLILLVRIVEQVSVALAFDLVEAARSAFMDAPLLIELLHLLLFRDLIEHSCGFQIL